MAEERRLSCSRPTLAESRLGQTGNTLARSSLWITTVQSSHSRAHGNSIRSTSRVHHTKVAECHSSSPPSFTAV